MNTQSFQWVLLARIGSDEFVNGGGKPGTLGDFVSVTKTTTFQNPLAQWLQVSRLSSSTCTQTTFLALQKPWTWSTRLRPSGFALWSSMALKMKIAMALLFVPSCIFV